MLYKENHVIDIHKFVISLLHVSELEEEGQIVRRVNLFTNCIKHLPLIHTRMLYSCLWYQLFICFDSCNRSSYLSLWETQLRCISLLIGALLVKVSLQSLKRFTMRSRKEEKRLRVRNNFLQIVN